MIRRLLAAACDRCHTRVADWSQGLAGIPLGEALSVPCDTIP